MPSFGRVTGEATLGSAVRLWGEHSLGEDDIPTSLFFLRNKNLLK